MTDWNPQDPVNERVLSIGVAGDGADFYRVVIADGSVRFGYEGSSDGMFNGEEDHAWTSALYDTFEEVLESVSDDWVMFSPIEIHPDYRDETWRVFQATCARIPDLPQKVRPLTMDLWARACGRSDSNGSLRILDMAVEGGGATLFRFVDETGAVSYGHHGSSMGLDDDDDKIWHSWDSENSSSFEVALLAITGDEFILFTPQDIHPDYREQTWHVVQHARVRLAKQCGPVDDSLLIRWAEACGHADDAGDRRRQRDAERAKGQMRVRQAQLDYQSEKIPREPTHDLFGFASNVIVDVSDEGEGVEVIRIVDLETDTSHYSVSGRSVVLSDDGDVGWYHWDGASTATFADAVHSMLNDHRWITFNRIAVHSDYHDETWELVRPIITTLLEPRTRRPPLLRRWAVACGRDNP